MQHTTQLQPAKSANNANVFTQTWTPDNQQNIEAVICLVHGLGEHSGRYEHVAQFFTDNNIVVTAIDLNGHGKTEGTRGDTLSYNLLLDQVDDLVKQATQQFPNKPIFIYGHSMGGNIVIAHALQRKPAVKGFIVTAPFLEPGTPIPTLKFLAGKVIGSIYGAFRLPNGLDVNKLARDPKVGAAYTTDPLVHDQISARWFFPAYQVAKDALAGGIKNLKTPMLLMHGTADELTNFAASKRLAAQNTTAITFKEWTGFYHELHNEPEQREIMNYELAWMHQQMK